MERRHAHDQAHDLDEAFDVEGLARRHGVSPSVARRRWQQLAQAAQGVQPTARTAWLRHAFTEWVERAAVPEARGWPGKRTLTMAAARTQAPSSTGPRTTTATHGGLQIASRRSAQAAIAGEVLTVAAALELKLDGLAVFVDERARQQLASRGLAGMQVGRVVYLHPEVYQPGTEAGRYLLAHELTQVAQRALPSTPGRGYRAAEAEATAIGLAYARGHAIDRTLA